MTHPASPSPKQAAAAVTTSIARLNLRHTWTTTMAASDWRDTLFVHYCHDGIEGIGEGAPIATYKESAESARAAVQSLLPLLQSAPPAHFHKIIAQVHEQLPGEWAAKSAIDIALMDWIGKHRSIPIYEHYGLDPADAPTTSFSIGIDKPDVVRQKVREAEEYLVLKIKVGLDSDEEIIAAVRSVTQKPLRVDANQGWTDRELAASRIDWLSRQGVQFIEQPMPAAQIEDLHWLRQRASLPLMADESCRHLDDIPNLVGVFDYVNIKLDKAGGIGAAYQMLQTARALGFKTMLGCMVSSSCAITAAAHLSPLADFADLDGHLLVANDPYQGVTVEDGKLKLPSGPGLGLQPA
jgi:L-alanine-DL-glutamate epimerase-like enolase superfamily enzyme